MATIKDIAAKLGISSGTVSKGLNGASDISEPMRQAVLHAAVELGYKPKNIVNKASKKVCIFVQNMNYESIDQFGYEIIYGFEQEALSKGFQVTVISANLNMQTKESFDTYMLRHGYPGAFLLDFELHDDYVTQMHTTKVPTVLLNNHVPGNPHVGYVGTDNYEGLKDITSHLHELGHRNIAFLNGTKNSMITQKKLDAFYYAMKEKKIPIRDKLVAFGHYNIDCAQEFVPDFVRNGATAIICASDFIASGVIKVLHSMGLRVPEDVSVTGYDDLPIARFLSPALTTIRQNRTDLGKSAFLLLDALMNGIAISRIELCPQFIARDSAAQVKTLGK